jgi:hypothetical protein
MVAAFPFTTHATARTAATLHAEENSTIAKSASQLTILTAELCAELVSYASVSHDFANA